MNSTLNDGSSQRQLCLLDLCTYLGCGANVMMGHRLARAGNLSLRGC